MQVVGNRVFLPGEKTMEVHITIADDITVEYSEIFTMTLLSEDSHVMSNSKQVEFTIIDNDGEHIHTLCTQSLFYCIVTFKHITLGA